MFPSKDFVVKVCLPQDQTSDDNISKIRILCLCVLATAALILLFFLLSLASFINRVSVAASYYPMAGNVFGAFIFLIPIITAIAFVSSFAYGAMKYIFEVPGGSSRVFFISVGFLCAFLLFFLLQIQPAWFIQKMPYELSSDLAHIKIKHHLLISGLFAVALCLVTPCILYSFFRDHLSAWKNMKWNFKGLVIAVIKIPLRILEFFIVSAFIILASLGYLGSLGTVFLREAPTDKINEPQSVKQAEGRPDSIESSSNKTSPKKPLMNITSNVIGNNVKNNPATYASIKSPNPERESFNPTDFYSKTHEIDVASIKGMRIDNIDTGNPTYEIITQNQIINVSKTAYEQLLEKYLDYTNSKYERQQFEKRNKWEELEDRRKKMLNNTKIQYVLHEGLSGDVRNWHKLKKGMLKKEIIEAIGKPIEKVAEKEVGNNYEHEVWIYQVGKAYLYNKKLDRWEAPVAKRVPVK